MKTIIVTGTPGTGKTQLAKKLASKLNFDYIDVNKIITKYNLAESYDKKRKTKVVDINKLNKALIREIASIRKSIKNEFNNKTKSMLTKPNKKYIKNNRLIKNKKIKNGIVIDSHLSHYLPKKYVDLCIVTKCDLKALQERLKKRKYPKEKIRENLDAEIFDICSVEAREKGHNILVIDCTRPINIKNIIKAIIK